MPKLKSGFVLREVAGSYVVISSGNNPLPYKGMIKLNKSGALLWNMLENGADTNDLISSLTEKYSVTVDTAKQDANKFLDILRRESLLE
jgi:hypothetical protein